MPPTTENIPEKPAFDVYAMMLILSFVFVVGATVLLNDELDKHWGFWTKKEDSEGLKRATHISRMNDGPEALQGEGYVKVTKEDLDDWKTINKGQSFPIKDYEWPEGYDPLKYPVKADQDNLDPTKIPEDQRGALMKGHEAEPAATPTPPPPDPTATPPPPPPPPDNATPPPPAEKKEN